MSDKQEEADRVIATVGDVHRIRCMCGDLMCGYCGHRMSAHCTHREQIRYCPACGHPLIAATLNGTKTEGKEST